MGMKNAVTVQDIANALGISRNTVSKALNGRYVPEKTRTAVINAAVEMGYRGYSLASAATADPDAGGPKRFVICSSCHLININYYVAVLRGMEESLDNRGIDLVQFCVSSPDSFQQFKLFLSRNQVDGIVYVEFFTPEYIQELLRFKFPVIFLDFPVTDKEIPGSYDIVLPESRESVQRFCTRLIREQGCKTFGFVGAPNHCRSFHERFLGMREALFQAGLPLDLQYSITDAVPFGPEALMQEMRKLPRLPDCFVAANDTVAIGMLIALKEMGIQVPEQVKVFGFDNIVESKRCEPLLSTIHVNKNQLGKRIISLLMNRNKDPMRANEIIYVASTPIVRDSTG